MGCLDPDAMLERMSPKLLDQWMAYSLLEPFGEEWRQTAEMCATHLNSMGGRTNGPPFTAKDMHFMPKLPDLTPEDGNQKVATEMFVNSWRSYSDRQTQQEAAPSPQ